MFYRIILILVLISFGYVCAEPIMVTPVKKISTTKKDFMVGNKYQFKDVKTGEIYTGEVLYYRPNGMAGREAQVEIGNFTDSSGGNISGQITFIPANHKAFQEYSNYFIENCSMWIRGSEVIILPDKHNFMINTDVQREKRITLKLRPSTVLSTVHDEIEIGDIIKFTVINNVYKNNKLFISAGTPIFGTVDYLDENGWGADNAAIYIKQFKTKSINGKDLIINSDLKINGLDIIQYKSKHFAQFFNYISLPIRGKEIDIKSYDKNVTFDIVFEN